MNRPLTILLILTLFLSIYMAGDTEAVTAFRPDMIVEAGAVKAFLVIGSINPDPTGLTADSESSDLIKSSIEKRYNQTVDGWINQFTDGENNLDNELETTASGGGDGDDVMPTDTSTPINGLKGDDYDEKWLVTDLSNHGEKGIVQLSSNWAITQDNTNNSRAYGLWVDGDFSGDIERDRDWPVYNDIRILDWMRNEILLQPAMRAGNITSLLGRVIEIKGKRYVITKHDPLQRKIELVQVDEKTIVSASAVQDIPETALMIPNSTIRIGLTGLSTSVSDGFRGVFALVVGGDIVDFSLRSSQTNPALKVGRDLELDSGLIVIPTEINVERGFLELAIGWRKDMFSISDGDRDVLGYAHAVVGDQDEGWGDELRFTDESIKVPRGKFKRIGDTPNFFLYMDNREMDILRRMPLSTPLSEERVVPLSITSLKDIEISDFHKKGFNLILFGGPYANLLTKELVESGRSTVDWERSSGDFEVVSDAFSEGQYAIIVAGKDRTSTRTAAEALAAMV